MASLRQAFPIAASLALSLLLGGCFSDGSEGIEEARQQPNSFPPTQDAGQQFDEGGENDTQNTAGLERNEVRVTLQVTQQMAGGTGVPTRRNLVTVPATNIRVVRLNTDLAETETLDVSIREGEGGSSSRIVGFPGRDRPPQDADLFAIATAPDGTQVRGPLFDGDNDVKLSPFSEFLVTDIFGSLTGGQLSQLQGCDQTVCLEALVWPGLVDQAQNFEIDIPANLDLQGAVDFLRGRGDFVRFAIQMRESLLTEDEEISDTSASSTNFHTVYFALGLSRAEPEAGQVRGQWSTRTDTVGSAVGNGVAVSTRGQLSLTAFSVAELGIDINGLDSQVPFSRKTLRQESATAFSADEDWQTNDHSATPSGAFIRSIGEGLFVQTGRSPFQTITQDNGLQIGWAPNPYFFDASLGGTPENTSEETLTTPQTLLTSYFQSAKAILLESNGDGFDRVRNLEELALGTYDINLRKFELEDEEDSFPVSEVNGSFRAIDFAVRLSEQGNPVKASTRLRDWTVTTGSPSPGVAETGIATTELERTSAGDVNLAEPQPLNRQFTLENRDSEVVDNTSTRLVQDGRLALVDTSNGDRTLAGASTAARNFLAFTHDDQSASGIGRGLKLVLRSAEEPLTPQGTYKLQGVLLGMGPDTNTLHQLNESTLTLGATEGTLNLSQLKTVHTISTQAVAAPAFEAEDSPLSGPATFNDGQDGRVQVTIPDVQGEDMILDGFASVDEKTLVLTVQWGNRIGLLLGHAQ